MTPHSESPSLSQGPRARPNAGTGLRKAAGSAWVAAIPALVTFGAMLYQIGRPSLTQDEISTLSDTHRTLPELFRLLGNLDAVHGFYYVLMWAWERMAGFSPVALRIPSAVAMAAAAGLIALIGQRLASKGAGLAAGLVFASFPQVSWYGQDVRDIALDTALAAAASYLLIRALEPGPRRRWLTGYGVVLTVLGPLNFFCLLIVAAHGVTLAAELLRCRRAAAGAGEAPARAAAPPVLGWLVSVEVAVLVTSPIMIIGWRQRGQIGWITPPDMATLGNIGRLIGPPSMLVAVLVITAAGVAVSALGARRRSHRLGDVDLQELRNVRRRRARLRRNSNSRLVVLSVSWLLLPAALLLAASLVHPVWTNRYAVFCLPAAALLVGRALAALGRIAGPVGLAVIVALSLPMQAAARAPDGHGEDLRPISQILATYAHPGDALLFGSRYVRKISIAYPAGFSQLRDISLGETAIEANQPAATSAPPALIQQRLTTVSKVWVVKLNRNRLPLLRKLGFKLSHSWKVPPNYRVDLYVRRSSAVR